MLYAFSKRSQPRQEHCSSTCSSWCFQELHPGFQSPHPQLSKINKEEREGNPLPLIQGEKLEKRRSLMWLPCWKCIKKKCHMHHKIYILFTSPAAVPSEIWLQYLLKVNYFTFIFCSLNISRPYWIHILHLMQGSHWSLYKGYFWRKLLRTWLRLWRIQGIIAGQLVGVKMHLQMIDSKGWLCHQMTWL